MPEISADGHLWRVGQQVWQPRGRARTRAKTFSQWHLPCFRVSEALNMLLSYQRQEQRWFMALGLKCWKPCGRAAARESFIYQRCCPGMLWGM